MVSLAPTEWYNIAPMRQENIGTFHAEPFAGISGSKPKRSRRRRHSRAVSQCQQPLSRAMPDDAREPESLADAVEMREAHKRRIVAMQSEVRGLNGEPRAKMSQRPRPKGRGLHLHSAGSRAQNQRRFPRHHATP